MPQWYTPNPRSPDLQGQLTLRQDLRDLFLFSDRQSRADLPLPSVFLYDLADSSPWRVDFGPLIQLTSLDVTPQCDIYRSLAFTGGYSLFINNGLMQWTPRIIKLLGLIEPTLTPGFAHVASPPEISWFGVDAQGMLDYTPLGYPGQLYYFHLLDFKNGIDLYRFTLTTALSAAQDLPVFDVTTPVDRVQADENVAVFFPRGILLPNGYTLFCEDGFFKVSNELPTQLLTPIHYNNVSPRLSVVNNELVYAFPG